MIGKKCLFLCLIFLGFVACGPRTIEETATAVPTPTPSHTPTAPPTATPELRPTETVTAVPTPTLTPTPTHPEYSGPTLNRSNIGVQVYLHRVDVPALVAQLNELGVGWVKAQVSWKLFQPYPDQFSEEQFADLDALVAQANASGIRVMISVAKAPEWSRPTTELDGPPADYDLYRQFMQRLAQRYKGQVAAYELWNEPNLHREWNGLPLDPAALVELIRVGAEGVRAADPAALVISAAPAVTGINDGFMAIDDRVYFRGMLAAGVAGVVDGFGVHPYGWANPPDATFENPDTAVPSHNNHPSFFFQDTLRDYGALLDEFGIAGKQLWVTEFGWGSFETFGQAPPAGAEFMSSVSEWQQAAYTQRAFSLAHNWPWVGPMMLWNLNFAPWLGPAFSESGYSLLRPDGTWRPVFFAVAGLPKQ
ncbi:MAG: cellulase family glycosylhydrolase [Anaerolineaceae bacterium]|nr:cellulase family glycosylhydrolase [Anaerolineaceae bacterium]